MAKLWSYSFGHRGWRVRAAEIYSGSNLYLIDSTVRVSLKHKDRERAMDQCEEAARRKRRGLAATPRRATLKDVMDAYAKHCSAHKSAKERAEDARRTTLYLPFFGDTKDPAKFVTRK